MAPRNKKLERFKYSEEQMLKAVAAVRNGISQREASKRFDVPRGTLFDKLNGRTQMKRKIGPDPYLSQTEEQQIVDWIHRCGRRGLPPHVNDVLNTVKNIVKTTQRKTPFTNGRPGRFWFQAFKRRNPQISEKARESV